VFIGGAIAPLLQTDPPFPRARVTSDVDGVVASQRYGDLDALGARLRARGFRQDPHAAHLHRWTSPSGIPFDLVPAGAHPGGSGNPWDAAALDTSDQAILAGGVVIRHARAPAFLAQKWAAHHDRGREHPLDSHDLEDILALLASRPGIVEEVTAAPPEVGAYLAAQARGFLADPDAADLLAAHLNNAQDAAATIGAVRRVLERLTSPQASPAAPGPTLPTSTPRPPPAGHSAGRAPSGSPAP
jgi:predicted nucleotidyltransferase